MKNWKIITLILIAAAAFAFCACEKGKADANLDAGSAQSEQMTETEDLPEKEELTEPDRDKSAAKESEEMVMQLKIEDTIVDVDWEDNDAVKELKALCEDEPLTIQLSQYGGFEQVGSIGTNLTSNDVQMTTSSGDIVLYSGNQIVVFYGSNSWSYTKLGHITDRGDEGMKQLLDKDSVTITISGRE